MAHLHHTALFRGRHFPDDVIILALRWYLRYSLSYRDLEDLLAERCVDVDHTTIWRWVDHYGPELDQRLRPYLRPTLPQWRADETYIRVAGEWTYLYRAVDLTGATVDFYLSPTRDVAAAHLFLRKAMADKRRIAPVEIVADGNPVSNCHPGATARRDSRSLSLLLFAQREQHHRAGPPRHSAARRRQAAFPVLRWRVTHNRRLRGHAHVEEGTG